MHRFFPFSPLTKAMPCGLIHLREPLLRDARAFCDLFNHPAVNPYLDEEPLTLARARAILRDTIKERKVGRIMAFLKEELVGTIGLYPLDATRRNHVCDIGLMVHPRHQKKGIGSLLLDVATGYALTHGIQKFEIGCYADNAHALSFYKKHGFQQEGTLSGSLRRSNVYIDYLVLSKWISAPPKRRISLTTSPHR